MSSLLVTPDERFLYKTVCVEHVLNSSLTATASRCIIDKSAATCFVRAVEALDPRPPCVQIIQDLDRGKAEGADPSTVSSSDAALLRFTGIFFEPVTNFTGVQLYCLDVDKLLRYLDRHSFTWTTYHASEEEYETARRAIRSYFRANDANIEDQETPASITASEALAQYKVFDTPAGQTVVESTPRRRAQVTTKDCVPPDVPCAASTVQASTSRSTVSNNDVEMETISAEVELPYSDEEADHDREEGSTIQAKASSPGSFSSGSDVTSMAPSVQAQETVVSCLPTVRPVWIRHGSSSDSADGAVATPHPDDLELDDDDAIFREAGLIESTVRSTGEHVDSTTVAASTSRTVTTGDSADEVMEFNHNDNERNIEIEAFDVAAELEAAFLTKQPRYPEHYLTHGIGGKEKQTTSKRKKVDAFPIPQVQYAEWEMAENLRAARTILAKIKVLALDTSQASLRNFCPYSLRGEKHAILSMSAQYTLNIGRDDVEDGSSASASRLNMRIALEKLFARYDGTALLSQQRAAPGAWSASRQDSETAENGFLLLVLRLLRHRFMYLQERGHAQRKAGEHLASDFDALLPVVPPDARPGRVYSSRKRDAMNTEPRANSSTTTSMLWRRSSALCRIVVACDHPCIVLVLVRLAIRLRIRLSTLLDELPLPQFCHWVATGTVSQSRLQAEKSTQSVDDFGETIRHDLSATSKAAAQGQAEQLERNLQWAHEHILLPLLAVAAQRVPLHFFALDGRQECSVETCLHAIVPHPKQPTYADFRAGNHRDWQWERGRVVLEGSAGEGDDNDEAGKSHACQYSIATQRRTFRAYDVADFGATCEEVFDPPPAFLINRVLVWGSG